MSKRKLSNRQHERVHLIQKKRLDRAQAFDDLNENHLGPEQEGLVIARHGPTVNIEDLNQQIFFCHLRQNLEDLVPGDKVIWRQSSEQIGVVVALVPRKTLLYKPDHQGNPKPIAANVSKMVIVFAPEPEPHIDLINKYLVASELLQIPALIVLNKADLINHAEEMLQTWLTIFKGLNYPVLETSTLEPKTLKPLSQYLADEVSIFLGQSGVGKSSLINNLLPDMDIKVGELSQKSKLGKHTTTMTRLYHLPSGGDLIDSPGVRNFTLWEITPQDLIQGFVECKPFLNQCKFSNCRHLKEPGCKIKEAVAQGQISKLRFASLQHLLSDLH
jgi:ribosome biogenesis GTPase